MNKFCTHVTHRWADEGDLICKGLIIHETVWGECDIHLHVRLNRAKTVIEKIEKILK